METTEGLAQGHNVWVKDSDYLPITGSKCSSNLGLVFWFIDEYLSINCSNGFHILSATFTSQHEELKSSNVVLGLPAWLLIAVTEYVHSAALGWVMFVSIFCWVLTVVLLLLYLAKALTRMPQLPWDTTLVFNCSAALVYAVAGVVEATLVASSKEEDSYSAWAASTVCVFLVSLSYACSSILSLRSWRAMQDGGEGG
uniref:MARVEL domain-containing protein n=1 Tax=Denticeps clupeoides TaxID=299321 RepID=A0AAY4B5C0_9TELE